MSSIRYNGPLNSKVWPSGGYETIDGEKITIEAGIYTMGGYSAHAGQTDLLNFVKRMWRKPSEIRLVHSSERAKQYLQVKLRCKYPQVNVWIP
ncbi:MBL fold metallo-hydrolase RNA specificity domain-containing protein [Pseudomonas sp. HK3]